MRLSQEASSPLCDSTYLYCTDVESVWVVLIEQDLEFLCATAYGQPQNTVAEPV